MFWPACWSWVFFGGRGEGEREVARPGQVGGRQAARISDEGTGKAWRQEGWGAAEREGACGDALDPILLAHAKCEAGRGTDTPARVAPSGPGRRGAWPCEVSVRDAPPHCALHAVVSHSA